MLNTWTMDFRLNREDKNLVGNIVGKGGLEGRSEKS